MRKIFLVAILFGLAIPSTFAAPPQPAKGNANSLVIVFKDGHRQVFNLADIAKVEFPLGATAVAEKESVNPQLPSRGRFLGKWEVGDGSGNNFYITLEDHGDAWRSLRSIHGKWVYADGEAQVTWDDGAKDAIRKVGSHFQKFAYSQEKSFTDTPDNVTDAQNTAPHPI